MGSVTSTPTATVTVTETPSPSTSETPSVEPSASATPTDTPEPVDSGIPVSLTCDQLISAQQMYEFNPNFSLDDSWTPSSTSRAAFAIDYQGIACSWVNDSSGERITVSVVHLRSDSIAASKADRAAAGAVAPYGYFTVDGKVGEADAFSGDFWVMADSKTFFESGDAAQLVGDAVEAVS